MTRAEVVVDASAVVLGLLSDEGGAAELLDEVARAHVVAHAPDLLVPEVANALRTRIVVRRWPIDAAQERLSTFLAVPIALQESSPIVTEALSVAAELGLSVYDALYAALAQALEIPLVTADKRLAAAVAGAVLVA